VNAPDGVSSGGGNPSADRKSRGPRGASYDTRTDILEAAATVFVERGFERGSLRAVAREADVDPALVRHYFSSKAELFVESLTPVTSAELQARGLLAPAEEEAGEAVLRLFLMLWDSPERGPRLATILRATSTSPQLAKLVNRVLVGEMLSTVLDSLGVDHREWRASVAASQIIGLAWTRYILAVEPLASADVEDLIATMAPDLQRALTGDLGDLPAVEPA
jgi:AcrR family transcriptional regulator